MLTRRCRAPTQEHIWRSQCDGRGSCNFPTRSSYSGTALADEMPDQYLQMREYVKAVIKTWEGTQLNFGMLNVSSLTWLRPDAHPGPGAPHSNSSSGRIVVDCSHYKIAAGGVPDTWCLVCELDFGNKKSSAAQLLRHFTNEHPNATDAELASSALTKCVACDKLACVIVTGGNQRSNFFNHYVSNRNQRQHQQRAGAGHTPTADCNAAAAWVREHAPPRSPGSYVTHAVGTNSAASRIQQARHLDDVPGAARIQRAAVAALHNACGNPLKLNTTPAADFNLCFTDGISLEAFKRLQLHDLGRAFASTPRKPGTLDGARGACYAVVSAVLITWVHSLRAVQAEQDSEYSSDEDECTSDQDDRGPAYESDDDDGYDRIANDDLDALMRCFDDERRCRAYRARASPRVPSHCLIQPLAL
ncbi:hypothetical protein EMIHUDRAFT_243194 [Emiliania huxleyi CCMP1516]|uniref:Trichome birefringence-like C-terminal domain-containing protein n=2 Tax=Emiliania huxleyi TaxID=2903 RepID=A0A0D3J6Q1_EMIH1|nr:hypothetical protein EMIHUDRAFT_243194 [Emiliania huxleyi CCMP1516]EOD19186.1 hypothetical protein EMIHUDRAFT_243194 [Emiliania huxleyi CCMP1516]|eukprot:XP_005771615.1 hypothetical protein EMIHUDRAFT_243194 [Emiliania huxleyi CCMP1516]